MFSFVCFYLFMFFSLCVPQSVVCAWLVCPISRVLWLNVVPSSFHFVSPHFGLKVGMSHKLKQGESTQASMDL